MDRAPLRDVVKSELFWTGNPHKAGSAFGHHFRRELLSCGHIDDFEGRNLKERKRRRCFECARLAQEARRAETPVRHEKDKVGDQTG